MNNTTNPNQSKNKEKAAKSIINQASYEHGKIQPQAVDIEETVLGAMMLEKDALTSVIDILKPDVFYKEEHKVIFKAMQELFANSQPVDIITVTNQLKSTAELEFVGGPYYITQLTNRIASAANIEYHARILLQKYIQRELIRTSSEIIRDAFEDTTDVFELLDKAESNLFSVSESNLRRSYDDMRSLIKEAVHQIETARDKEGHLSGIPSSFTDLDRVTSGWQKSDLIILAARPGMGKTAFALTMARNIAVDFKKPVAIFSLEMSALQLVTRLIASETGLVANKLKKGSLEPHEWEQLHTRINNLIDAPLIIDDTPALSIFELRAKCRRLKAQHDIELVVIDYLQLMTSDGNNKSNREQEISNISRSLKSLAKELDVPIISLSQLSRAVETRGGSKKPILSDLRESGAIEQDADIVMFIYRPEYYKIDEDEHGESLKGIAELSIAKHRNGALEDIQLNFIDKFARFTDLEVNDYASADLSPNEDFENEEQTYTFQSKMNNDDASDGGYELDEEDPF